MYITEKIVDMVMSVAVDGLANIGILVSKPIVAVIIPVIGAHFLCFSNPIPEATPKTKNIS